MHNRYKFKLWNKLCTGYSMKTEWKVSKTDAIAYFTNPDYILNYRSKRTQSAYLMQIE